MKPKNYHTISITNPNGIGYLRLNQPPSNKMTMEFFEEFSDFISGIRKDPPFRALIITGTGRHFSSGADLDNLLTEIRLQMTGGDDGGDPLVFLQRNSSAFLDLWHLKIPVIAAIRGVCLGSALELALFCHFRFCGEDAVFGSPETTFNLIPGLGGITMISGYAGRAKAMEVILRGKTFTADLAAQMGLVDKVLPKKEVIDRATRFANAIGQDYRFPKKQLYLRKYFSE